jgi:hypothetical protein
MNKPVKQPSIFLIGSGKSGTTSLYHYFMAHPMLYLPPLKEPNFFAMPEFALRTSNNPQERGRRKDVIYDLEAYHQLYSACLPNQLALDCSPSYLMHPLSAQRIHEFNPDSKILAILRHPVERAFSAYSHLVRENFETLSFSDGLQAESQRAAMGYGNLWRYRKCGFYTENLQQFEKVFTRSRMKVMLFDDLKSDPASLLKEIYEFLEIEPILPKTFLKYNVSGVVSSPLAYKFIGEANPTKNLIKKILPLEFLRSIKAKTLVSMTKKLSMPEADAHALATTYKTEIENLETWLQRDLGDWKSRY